MGQVFNYICLDFWSILFELERADPARSIIQAVWHKTPHNEAHQQTNLLLPVWLYINSIQFSKSTRNTMRVRRTGTNLDHSKTHRVKGCGPTHPPHGSWIPLLLLGPTSMPISGPTPDPWKSTKNFCLTDSWPHIHNERMRMLQEKVAKGKDGW